MKLTVVGCSGSFPSAESACSSYLVEADGFRLLLDMGNGALGELQRHCGLYDLDAIFLSHLHADHCIDLVAYSYARRYHPDGFPPQLPVYGPEGTCARICGAFETPPVNGLLDVYDFHELPVGTTQIGPFEVTSAATNHPVECHALRLTAAGRTLAYSADTGVSDALVELARDADLFVCEASWEHSEGHPPDVHLSGLQAGEHATRAGARRLLLTHLVAWSDPDVIRAEAKAAYNGELDVAQCGRTYEI